jgi:hypothetical protein
VQVDGEPTPSFDRIVYEFGFAHGDAVDVTVVRNSVSLPLRLPVVRSEPGTPGMFTGARPLSRLTMTEAGPKGTGLKKGDEILKANGVELFSIEDLIRVLNEKPADSAELFIRRFEGGTAKELTLTVPLKKVPRVVLRNLRDVQTGKSLPDVVFEEGMGTDFQNIFVNGESFSTFAEFRSALESAETPPKLRAGPVEITGTVELGFRRQIGIRPAEKPVSSLSEMSFLRKVMLSFDETIFITKSTVVGLWRIIEGKLSFNKSVSGPVKMVAIAAKTVELGWQTYFLLLAQITIILGSDEFAADTRTRWRAYRVLSYRSNLQTGYVQGTGHRDPHRHGADACVGHLRHRPRHHRRILPSRVWLSLLC